MGAEIPFSDFLGSVKISLFGFAIVNPMGPTFMGFSLCRKGSSGSTLVFFSLNPFIQKAEVVGNYDIDSEAVDAASLVRDNRIGLGIERFLQSKKSDNQEFGTPTLLYLNPGWEDEESLSAQIPIALSIIEYSRDPYRTLKNLNDYPMDVMGRVSHEMSSIQLDPETRQENPAPSEDQLIETLMHICDPRHITQEIKGFNIAWAGSIKFQRENGNAKLANRALALRDGLKIIGKLFPPLFQMMMD